MPNIKQMMPDITARPLRTARIADFRAATSKILFGERLARVAQLEASIAQHGLMTPLKVTRAGTKLIVIDGRKRLAALRRMRFKGTLPRSLVNIPYVMGEEPCPHLLSEPAQYQYTCELLARGGGASEVAQVLCISQSKVREILSVGRLSPRLKRAFLGRTISLSQAAAFAALPQASSQDALMLSLGPFASAAEIISSVASRSDATSAQSSKSYRLDNVIAMRARPIKGLPCNIDYAA